MKDIHAHNLKRNQFFFFANGKKRMVAEEVKTNCGWTTITATTAKGRTYKRTVFECSKITIYE